MWKFLLSLAAVAGLVIFGDLRFTMPEIPKFYMVLPVLFGIFLTGYFFSQR